MSRNQSRLMPSTRRVVRLPRQHAPTVFGAVEEWLLDRQTVRNLSENTVTWYRERIAPVLELVGADTPVTELVYEDVQQVLLDARSRGRADTGVHGHFRAARAFTRWCVRQGWTMDQRLVVMEPPVIGGEGEVEIFPVDDVARLWKAAGEGLRDRLIVGLFLGTGVRLSELCGLQLGDKHEEVAEVRWMTAKGRKTRWVPLTPRLQRDWIRYVSRERPDTTSPALFVQEHRHPGEPLKPSGVESLLNRLGAAANTHCHPHRFRHTFATWHVRKCLESGEPFDPERLKRILGHSSYKLFDTYIHLAERDFLVKGWEKVAPY